MRKIIVFADSFFALSETFIFRQVQALSVKFEVTIVNYQFVNSDLFNFKGIGTLRLKNSTSQVDRLLSAMARTIFKMDLPFSFGNQRMLSRYVRDNGIEFLHAHYGWNGVNLLPFAKKNRLKLIVSFHGNDASGALRRLEYANKLPLLFDYASAVIVCSRHMLTTLNLHRFREKVYTIPYGIKVEEFVPQLTERLGAVKILHSGRLVGKKGVPDLVRVVASLVAEYPEVRLDVIGDGPEKERCSELVAECGLQDKVVFHGAQPLPIVKEFMRKAHIFVLNSRKDETGDMEGLPNSILEAMAMKKAVISTYHAGIPDVIENGINGLLVEECNNTQLYEAIRFLILRPELRIELGEAGRARVASQFTHDIMADKISNLFDSL